MLPNGIQVDPVLMHLATGYTNSEFIGHALFPEVLVEKETGKIPIFTKESFRTRNTLRSMRANSNRLVTETASTTAFQLEEHDAEYPIDYRELTESDMLSLEAHGANVTKDVIGLTIEKACADAAQTSGSYGSNTAEISSSNAKWTNYTHADSVPLDNIETGKAAIRASIGRHPNTAVFGYESFKALKRHPSIIELIKYSALGVLTIDLLKQLLDIENIFIGKAIYMNEAGTTVDVWSDNVILAHVSQTPTAQRTIFEPNYGYTLRKKGFPQPDVRDEQGGKLHLVRNTDIVTVQMVGAVSGYLIENTN